MAVHNGKAHLASAIESILAQTYKDFEFLIVDDASTDGSGEWLAACKDRRIRVITNDRQRGLAASLNTLIEQAAGELIARMDADDVALPERFTAQIRCLHQRPEVGVLGTRMKFMTEKGELQGEYSVPLTDGAIRWKLLLGNPFAHPTVMYRRELIKEVGGYDPEISVSQDKDLWVRLFKMTKFANLPDILLHYRRLEQGNWMKKQEKARVVSSKAGKQIEETLSGSSMSWKEWDDLIAAVNYSKSITREQADEMISSLLILFSRFQNNVTLNQTETIEVSKDLTQMVGRLIDKTGQIERKDLSKEYWRSVVPEIVWESGRKVLRRKRGASR